ncbi:MAG: LysM peptidoglycan-binding domain-containing protein [Saprospiraceae bacterium]
MRLTKLFGFLCCLAISQTAFADRIYLEYNSACMDIYEYHFNGNTSGKAHMVYHIPTSDIEKVILEVGVEANLNQPRKPSKTVSCGNFSLNERMVRQINSGATQLYIVKKDGRGYNVSPVGIATYAQINNEKAGYSTLDTRFSFRFDQPANGINLAANGSKAKVEFKGVVSNSCPKSYLFDKTRERGGRSFSSYVIVPEIGIIEEKNGFNANDAQNSVLKLVKINGRPYQQYIDTYCSDNRAGTNETFYFNGNFLNNDRKNDKKKNTIRPSIADLEGGNSTTGNTSTNSNNTTTNGSGIDFTTTNIPSASNCTVYKDLDRNIYMDFATGLPANTDCGGNTYINGRKIGESAPVVTTTTTSPPPPVTNTAPPAPTSPPPAPTNTNRSNCKYSSTYGRHVVQREETLYGISRMYGLTVAQIKTYNPGMRGNTIYPCMILNTQAAGQKANQVSIETDYTATEHVVKRGETLYQIATRYGFTVDRFRKFNGLSSTSTIYPGQVLKTKDCNCGANATSTETSKGFVPSEYNQTQARINTDEQAIAAQPVAKRRFHIVAEDDTIYSISKQYNITVSRLRKINDLEENEIIIPYQRVYLQ